MLRSDRQRREIIDGTLEPEQVPDRSSAVDIVPEELVCEEEEEESLDSGANESYFNATILPLEEPSSVPSASACAGIKILNRFISKSKSVANGPSKRDATAAELENTAVSKMPIPPMPIASSTVEPSRNPLLASSIQSRSEYDNPESRKRWEIEKFDKVVTFVRKQLSSSRTDVDKILFEYLKYPACYDISFLQALAVEFGVDISEIVRKKRASHKEVVNDLVNKLISK
jgi:hypothetical protein